MNGLVAAIKFLMETVIANGGGKPTLTFSVSKPANAVDMGEFDAGPNGQFIEGYYVLAITSVTESSESDDFLGYWTCLDGGGN